MSPPSALATVMWVIIPYLALAVFVLGHIWRYRYDRFGWTTRSSQIYESRLLRIGSPLFHYGIIFVFLGHAVGLGIPKSWTAAVGVTDGMYHVMAITIGLGAAAASVGGLAILIFRRRTNTRVFGA
ncbi:MAG TPA: respiratory nitrate reductase subunit gamma, partial [Brevibacterium sp.]|nr:respiratory nitrate reductase subunit gamma [Brevibacterium sp.]